MVWCPAYSLFLSLLMPALWHFCAFSVCLFHLLIVVMNASLCLSLGIECFCWPVPQFQKYFPVAYLSFFLSTSHSFSHQVVILSFRFVVTEGTSLRSWYRLVFESDMSRAVRSCDCCDLLPFPTSDSSEVWWTAWCSETVPIYFTGDVPEICDLHKGSVRYKYWHWDKKVFELDWTRCKWSSVQFESYRQSVYLLARKIKINMWCGRNFEKVENPCISTWMKDTEK